MDSFAFEAEMKQLCESETDSASLNVKGLQLINSALGDNAAAFVAPIAMWLRSGRNVGGKWGYGTNVVAKQRNA